MPVPTITAASAGAAQPPGSNRQQPPPHILIAPGTRDLVTPVSRGLPFLTLCGEQRWLLKLARLFFAPAAGV